MACFALLPRTRLYCTMCDKNVGTERITGLICSRKLGGCVNLSFLLGTRSTQRQGDKRSAAADVIASNALLRTRRHKARPFYNKTLPRGSNGDRSPLGLSFSPIFLQTKKDGATGGRSSRRAAGKNVQRKMESPKGVRLAERPVKT